MSRDQHGSLARGGAQTALRSISYAPESVRPFQRTESTSTSRPASILCRNLDQRPIADNEELLRWTEHGRVQPDDYLVCTLLDRCVQTRDVAELDAMFRTATTRRLLTAARGLAVAALALVWIAPLLSTLLLLTAIATPLVSIGKICPHRGNYMTLAGGLT